MHDTTAVHSAESGPMEARKEPAYEAIVVAGSAGAIKALSEFLPLLPADFPVPIVIVQHLCSSQQYLSVLDQVLNRFTKLQVKWAEHGEVLRAGTVYVAPQDHHVEVTAERTLRLSFGEKVNRFRPAADLLFISAARHFGSRVIGIVLSGGLSDGAEGTRQLNRAGSKVLVQDKASSDFFDMPFASLRNGNVDCPSAPEEIARLLMELVALEDVAEGWVVPSLRGARPAVQSFLAPISRYLAA